MRRIVVVSILILTFVTTAKAQFDQMNQQFGDPTNTTAQEDTVAASGPRFTFKQYFNALSHKDSTMQIGYMFAGSAILPGTAQIYNRDYWKLPVVYGGVGAMIYGGIHNNIKYQRTSDPKYRNYRNGFYIGAAAVYWASLLDGVISYETEIDPLPGRATLYSALLPGLGQAYNGDYWKIPIFVGGMGACISILNYNHSLYQRYNAQYKETGDSNARTLRDDFRRNRDYSFLATAVVYLLNVIDANVFSTMSDFDISDDISMNFSPAIIEPLNLERNFAYNGTNSGIGALGVQLSFRF